MLLSRLFKNISKNNVTYHKLATISGCGEMVLGEGEFLNFDWNNTLETSAPISLLAHLLQKQEEGQKRTSKQAADRQEQANMFKK